MFACPHCHKPIEINPSAQIPWYRFDPGDPKVGLGCGTLFMIGVIVFFCSGGSLRNDISEVQSEIRALGKKVDAVAESVKPAASAEVPPAIRIP